jgi:hypothetical protein
MGGYPTGGPASDGGRLRQPRLRGGLAVSGLQVIDISNPANPQRVGGYVTSGSATGVAVSGTHAYVAEGGHGLQIIDMSDPANPQRVGGYDTSGYAGGVAVSGHYAYVATGDAGLQIIDVSNPANPQRVGGYATGFAMAWPSRATTPTWRMGMPACRSSTSATRPTRSGWAAMTPADVWSGVAVSGQLCLRGG